MQYTKLILKNFGKIKKAEIEFSPFLLFIGDNNSGKSYLMTLIYGLIKYYDEIEEILFEKEDFILNCDIYKKIESIIDKNIKANKNNDNEIFLTIEELKLFNDLFNLLLNRNKKEIINYIFNSNNEINLDNILFDVNMRDLKIQIINKNGFSYTNKYIKGEFYTRLQNNNLNFYKGILRIIFEKCIEYTRGDYINRSVFLPTSRTGFLLSRKEFAKKSIDMYFSKNNIKKTTIFQKPVIDFINNLIDLPDKLNKREEYNKIIDIFKNNLFKRRYYF